MTKNESITCKRLNLEDIDSMNEFADYVIREEPHLDALVNASGVRELPDRQLTRYGIEKHFWVNFLAPYFLTSRLLDKLKERAKETGDCRIVNIIGTPKRRWSIVPDDINFEKRKYKPRIAYEQSKLALAHYTILLNKFHNDQGIRAYGVSPPNRVQPILEYKTVASRILYILGLYISVPASHACTGLIVGSIDKKVVEDDRSGGELISYLGQSWGRNKGWGPIADRSLEADRTWNLGAELLLKIAT